MNTCLEKEKTGVIENPRGLFKSNLLSAAFLALLTWGTEVMALPPEPAVAVHFSEVTAALETQRASGPTPTRPGTTGNQWWLNAWHYFVMPEALEEALRSDGTLFVEVSDADISAGGLFNSDGSPRYPIVISLAAEAVSDSEVDALRRYVAAGGTLFLGSSALTRQTDGSPRNDFALATEMGLHQVTPGLENWYLNQTFTKVQNHRLISHIPSGSLRWQMPLAADEIPWGTALNHGQNGPHYAWAVQTGDAQVLATGNSGPLLAVKQYGAGRIIYYGAMQPLIGHGGMDAGMYSYGIFRNAVRWAFESAGVPIIKLSPWRYPYDAAFTVRHDFETFTNLIVGIEASAQQEKLFGVKGDYYFCTGVLRENMGNDPGVIASLRRAVLENGATLGSHNGGLRNPMDLTLKPDDYFYWHWGPDEALDITPAGFSSGLDYAAASIRNSFQDIESWLAGTGQNRRFWVSPFFNSTRERSYGLFENLGVLVVGEQKISPFPHWTLSTQIPGKRFAHVTMPVSEWFIGTNLMQEVEGYNPQALHALVDVYYDMGALINLYGHKLSTETIATDYIAYSIAKPRLWKANSSAIYDWWTARSAASVTGSVSVLNGTTIARATISGAVDPETAVEMGLPGWRSGAGNVARVLLNGIEAEAGSYRFFGDGIRVRVGTNVTNVEVDYNSNAIRPQAADDFYDANEGGILNVVAPGVLGNDVSVSGRSATLVGAPVNGTVSLKADGSFVYTPQAGYRGTEVFSYKVSDGSIDSNVATVSIRVSPAGALYADDFTRLSDPALALPWKAVQGAWMISGGALRGGSTASSAGNIYVDANWADYSVQADIAIGAGIYGGGLGGRINPTNGAHYAAWIYPETSAGGMAVLRLNKFTDWWAFSPMQQVAIPGVGAGWHSLGLTFQSNQVSVTLDNAPLFAVVDTGVGGVPAYLSGGICADLWNRTALPTVVIDNVVVAGPPVANGDSYSVVAGGTLTVPASGVLGNDTAGSGRDLQAALVTGVAHGTLTFNADGAFIYIPATGYVGTDSFTYEANDGSLESSPAVVTLTVSAPTEPPIANDDNYTGESGKTLVVAAPGVLANDVAGEGRTLKAILVDGPKRGTLQLNADGSFSYTPSKNKGTEKFSYKITNGTQESPDVARVTIKIK